MESSSEGKPSEAHLETITSSAKNVSNLNPSLFGISFWFKSCFQSPKIIFYLRMKLNGPEYERNDEASKQSPTSFTLSS